MLDREAVSEFLARLADRYTGAEIVEILEDTGILTVEQLLALIEDYAIEGRSKFNVQKEVCTIHNELIYGSTSRRNQCSDGEGPQMGFDYSRQPRRKKSRYQSTHLQGLVTALRMKRHVFNASWRYTSWDTSMGEQLKKLNKNWKVKKHYSAEWSDLDYTN